MKSFRLIVTTLLASTCGLLVGTANAQLLHRYDFETSGSANDTVGTANGTIYGTATVSGGTLNTTGAAGGLSGGVPQNCVGLPASAVAGITNVFSIEIWFTASYNGAWCTTFSFSDSTTTNYVIAIPAAGYSPYPSRCAVKGGGGAAAEQLANQIYLDQGGIHDMVVTFDGTSVTYYLDGTLPSFSGLQNSFTDAGLNLSTMTYIGIGGGSPFADNAINGQVHDFRIYGQALLNSTQKSFIDSFNSAQLNTSCLYNSNLTNAEVWSNIPISTSFNGATRNGLVFSGLTSAQTNAALAIATAALSTTGKKLFADIRAADRYISGEVANTKGTTSGAWGFQKYFTAFIGTPSNSAPWMLQIGGHHMAYNISYNAPYMSGSPMFAGNEPNSWTDSTGTYAPLGTQRGLIVQLRPTLTTAALLSGTFSDVVFGPNGTGPGATSTHDTTQPKSYPTSGRGQLYSALNSTQQALVVSYILSWVNTQAPDRTADLLPIYTNAQALAETYIGYAGNSTNLSANANYFRVDGPRVWIEFSVQTGVYDMSSYHDHGLWRDKLADYGAMFGANTIATTIRPPAITTQPVSQTNAIGSNVTFSVTAVSTGTGTTNLFYQWYKDSIGLVNATNASLTIASITAANAGQYFVKVFSTGGLTNSSVAMLTVTTNAANTAPVLNSISNRMINPGYSLLITNVASDTDSPPQTLTFSLPAAPTNAAINSSSGILSWRPLIAQANSTNTFSVVVTDSGSPNLSATQGFNVIVSAATAPTNSTMGYTDGAYQMSVAGIVGPDYIIQASTNLVNWDSLYTTNPAVMPFSYTDTNAGNSATRFFRVLLGP